MVSLKDIYEVRKKIIVKTDIDNFQSMLDSEGISSTVNSDKSIRVESSEGLDKIIDSINVVMPIWYGVDIPFAVSLVYNLLPLSENMCLLKF